jgi:ATP-dependent exoDNAse (exonuclease V) alpha subunit
LLGELEVVREAVRPLTWTEEQKSHWDQYRAGDRLLFVRDTRFFRRGTAATVRRVLPDGLHVEGEAGRYAKITRKQRGSFDVGRAQMLGVSVGDRLLIRGREDEQGFANGDFKEVAEVDPVANRIVLTDGKELPPEFRAWTYGHALTSYRSQGSTAEESLLVLGEVAERALMRRQFYVGNTRYRGSHQIFVSHRDAILARLGRADPGRELASEFIRRHRLAPAERITTQHLHRMSTRLRQAWLGLVARWQETRQAAREGMEI